MTTRIRLTFWLRRLALISTLLSIPLSRCLWAGDSWERKPYTEWTESEALKVLQDSPWSRLTFIWLSSESLADEPASKPATGEVHSEQHSNCCRTFIRLVDGPSAEPGLAENNSHESAITNRHFLYYRVLLYSSARIRQALTRLRQIRGQIPDGLTDATLEKPLDDLVIAVAGPNMRPFENAAIKTITNSTYLRSEKGGKDKIELRDFVPSGMRQDGLALFVFSRQVHGKSAFSVEDDAIEFYTGEGAFRIGASFKLKKMVVNGITDF